MTLFTRFIPLFFLSTFLKLGIPIAVNAVEPENFRVGAYLPDYRINGDLNLNDTAPFLTDLMLFSAQPSQLSGDSMLNFCCLQSEHFELARQARAFKEQILVRDKKSPPLTLWLTVGGGGRSEHFLHDLDALALAIESLALKEKMDGVDLDCECFESSEDYRKYVTWIRKTTERLHSKGLLVSVALHAGQTLPSDLYKIIDRVHLMTYDLPGEKFHAEQFAVGGAIHNLVQSGCPRDRIIMGIPAYARHGETASEVKTFHELFDSRREKEGNSVYEDLDSFGEYEGYNGESPSSVRDKVKLAKEDSRVAGVFLWELGQDKRDNAVAKGGILLEAMMGRIFAKKEQDVRDEL